MEVTCLGEAEVSQIAPASVISAYKIPACLIMSFTVSSSTMFTSHFAFLALLTFLARANAGCATCAATVEVDGVAVYTLTNSTLEYDGSTLCVYTSKAGTEVTCEYSDSGLYEDGDDLCPTIARGHTAGC